MRTIAAAADGVTCACQWVRFASIQVLKADLACSALRTQARSTCFRLLKLGCILRRPDAYEPQPLSLRADIANLSLRTLASALQCAGFG